MSFWQRIKASVAGFSGYPDLIKGGVGSAIGYLALWLVIVVAIAGAYSISQSLEPVRRMQVALVRMPDFGLRGGEVYFDGPMPFKTQSDDGSVFIVDTNATSGAPLSGYENGTLITRNHMYQKAGGRVTDTDLSSFKAANISLNRADLVRWLGVAPGLVAAFQVVRYVWDFGAKLLCALVLGVLGLITARGVIGFEGTFTAGLYALTLPAALDIIIPRKYIPSFPMWLIHWALAITFTLSGVALAARKAREEQLPPAQPPVTP